MKTSKETVKKKLVKQLAIKSAEPPLSPESRRSSPRNKKSSDKASPFENAPLTSKLQSPTKTKSADASLSLKVGDQHQFS
ncbi:hypothetical protein MKW98_008017 [Papaver atlanticum]|uniref:Uncharacterized protein n=1 Tax=Papaver atlanticum TaxID=357466 RepID=A0AAD4SYK0_9MAGN|nr:hypothetical protein MKW98_008017 [Papaver atlanticum]